MNGRHQIHLKDVISRMGGAHTPPHLLASGAARWWWLAVAAAAAVLLVLAGNHARAEDPYELPPPPVALGQIDAADRPQRPASPRLPSVPRAPQLPEVPDEPGVDVAGLEVVSPENVNSVSELWSSEMADAAAPAAAPGATVRGPQGPTGIVPRPATRPAAEPLSFDDSAERPGDGKAELKDILQAVGTQAGGRSALEQMLYDQLRAAMPDNGEGFLFEKATLPAQLRLPQGDFTARFDFRLPQRGVGASPFTAQIFAADGAPAARVSGSVWIDREAAGVQATRVIPKGELIQPGDLKALTGRLSQLPRGALENAGELEGQSARQELRPGMWVTDQMVAATKLIKRGQPVTMRLHSGQIALSAPGVAKQDGTRGAVIKVCNLSSQREIFARVVGPDEVEVVQ